MFEDRISCNVTTVAEVLLYKIKFRCVLCISPNVGAFEINFMYGMVNVRCFMDTRNGKEDIPK